MLEKEVIISGIPNDFWQIHDLFTLEPIEEFRTQKEAINYARKKGWKIIAIESHPGSSGGPAYPVYSTKKYREIRKERIRRVGW